MATYNLNKVLSYLLPYRGGRQGTLYPTRPGLSKTPSKTPQATLPSVITQKHGRPAQPSGPSPVLSKITTKPLSKIVQHSSKSKGTRTAMLSIFTQLLKSTKSQLKRFIKNVL